MSNGAGSWCFLQKGARKLVEGGIISTEDEGDH